MQEKKRVVEKDPALKKDDLIVITGAGGFIAGNLALYFKKKGFTNIRAVDKKPLYEWYLHVPGVENLCLDVSIDANCHRVCEGAVEVYNLAADMGGMGFIHSAECEIMRNSALINIYMTHAAAEMGIPRYFFSSSVCVYRDMKPGEPEMTEADAIPAHPDNEYGWEKLYSERVALAFERRYGIEVRIARFQNCYGAEGTWRGGREKAPAAICRKVAEAGDGGTIDIWGDGTAIRSYTHVNDMVEGIYILMHSDLHGAVNIGCPQYVSVNELVATVAEVAGKKIEVNCIDGPVGVQSRNFSNERIYSAGWRPRIFLREGIGLTYPWIEAQVKEWAKRGQASS
jgi:nucleoside-diphosphate-sugar epimerase